MKILCSMTLVANKNRVRTLDALLSMLLLRKVFYALIFLATSIFLVACQPTNRSLVLDGMIMGTGYIIKVTNPPSKLNKDTLENIIANRLQDINQIMSTYIADSELSAINTISNLEAIPISEDLSKVLQESVRISTLSNGAFDITIGPLVNLWGFGPEIKPEEKVPNSEAIATALISQGMDKISISTNPNTITKHNDSIYLDLSAIAKGYAVDAVAKLLEAQNIENYMIEIGGELRVKGFNAKGNNWRIAIEKPSSESRSIHTIVQPQTMSVATSGDYRNYFEQNGKRYSHTIDPRSGWPIEHKLASVTVINESCATADALATALMVLGPDEGYNLATKEKIAALFISKNEQDFTAVATTEFQSYIVNKQVDL